MSPRDHRTLRVLLVGAGGLGCPAALVLARAGVARITICDPDRVEAGNLHRQILHRTEDIGRPKVESAADAIRRVAPAASVRAIPERFTAENASALLHGSDGVDVVDVVIDGSDNFATRFLVNDACVLGGVPFVHAAAVRWQGQFLAVDPRRGSPCYRCLFEAPPPAGVAGGCGESGVVGPAVGVVGALAAEAALAIADLDPAFGRLVTWDGLAGTLRAVRFRKNPLCTACGPARRPVLDPAAYEVPAC